MKLKFSTLIIIILGSFLFLSSTTFAQDTEGYGDLLDEEDESETFIEETPTLTKNEPKKTKKSILNEIFLNSSKYTLKHELVYHYKPAQTAINRTSFRYELDYLFAKKTLLHFDGKLSYNFAYDYLNYSKDIEDKYKFQQRLGEFYIKGEALENLSYTVGNQIVVWGELDSSNVVDFMSPRNFSEYVFTPQDETRLPQNMLVLDYYSGNSQISFVHNPAPKVNERPDTGHIYAIDVSIPQGFTLATGSNPTGGETAIVLKKVVSNSDLALTYADLIDNSYVLELDNLIFTPKYNRIKLLGLSANYGSGNFLFKAEAGLRQNQSYNSVVGFTYGIVKKDTLNMGLGIEYSPAGAYTLTLDASNSHIYDYISTLSSVFENTSNYYVSFSKDTMNNTLNFTVVGSYEPRYSSGVYQSTLDYDINDTYSIKGSIYYFDNINSASAYAPLKDKHRLSIELTGNL